MNVVALGAGAELAGFALAGVHVVPVHSDEDIARAWRTLDDDVGLAILSARAAAVLQERLDEHPDTLTVVAP